ncbi:MULTISPECIES: arylesterase [Methylocaldum]|jgi:acyl-CoA thioesterase-1|uniref:arylesterase n=1 Tax=Methylocaldum sp. 14B TaxID=1912213 RepID=UPI00098B768C|nr:arylesterase [Methylocaldum sp. 14B]MVF20687.1 arylesterase [Methylocaldum sp. BRCS4]
MRVQLKVAGMSVLLLWLVACGSSAKLPKLPTEAKVLAFGDSLTFGTGAGSEQSYPSVLQGLIGREVINAGVPGETSAEGLERLPALLDEHQPTLLILCHGGNDFLRNLGEQQAADNVRAMVKLARDRGISVVLIAVPKFGLMFSPPEFYAKIAEEFAIPFETGTLSKIIRDNSLKSDGVHPNGPGYRMLAEAVADRLKVAGAI